MSGHVLHLGEPARGYMPRAKANDWRTPREVLDLVGLLWPKGIDLDPCASPDPMHHFAIRNVSFEGIGERWKGRTFVNPPFDALAEWAKKCRDSHEEEGAEVVLLLPARTDTRYWHSHVAHAQAICLWKGRMRFVGATASAPFPTALVYWGPRPWDFHRVFREHGMVVAP